jgi:predicted Rossmann fold flavoprotein
MVLDKSKEIDRLIKQGNIMLSIDLFSNINNFDDYFEKIINKNKNSSIKKILSLGIPSKLVEYVISFSKVDGNKKGNNILKQERLKIGNILKKITLHPIGLLGFDKSMVTSGGVSLKEIDSKTMKSKIIDNLFFAGEIIDLDGPCGGYNLQICWTTGHLAGINA